MKILIVQLGWSGHGVSGGDKHLLEAATEWKEKHDLTVLLPRNGQSFIEKKLRQDFSGLGFWTLLELIHFSNLNNLVLVLAAYTQRLILGPLQVLFSGRKFRVVLSSSHFLYDLLPAILLKVLRGAKTVVYVYHLISDQGRPRGFRNWLSSRSEILSLWLVDLFFDLVIIDNTSVRVRLGQLGVSAQKIKLMPVGIRHPIVFPGLTKKYDLCFLGRLVRSKGVYDLIEIFKIIQQKLAGSRLLIIGTGSESGRLEAIFRAGGLSEFVTLAGEVDEENKYRLLQEAKVFVLPSYEEGWGIALGEAMSCGLPAVAYDLPVLKEIFGDGPVWVPLSQPGQMAEAAKRLLEDPDSYEAKVSDSRRSVADYYLDLVLPEELGIIERL